MPDLPEKIIKSKERVQQHGEVFTPKRIVNLMLDQPGIKEACEDLTTTFLEPSAGEGAFLVEILKRKLEMVASKFNSSLEQYENFSLMALSTIYAVELLEDNAEKCTMNMYQIFVDYYRKIAESYSKKTKDNIYKSAQLLIATNIIQGDFLTQLNNKNETLVFSEWKPNNLSNNVTRVKVDRTEFTLEEIKNNIDKPLGTIVRYQNISKHETHQISFFDLLDQNSEETTEQKAWKYTSTYITNVYKEVMQEVENE